LRGQCKLTLADLAELTHYSRGHLNNVERERKAPTAELAHACDCALKSGETLQSLVPERPRPEQHDSVRPAQLPGESPRFVGRGKQLDELDLQLGTSARARVAVVHGPPGVGKTALVLRWAHREAHRFPDGQLFVDLRGHAPSDTPADPMDILEEFLTAMGWPSGQMPPTSAERASLFRSLTHDRRLLVVLDNAATSGQVRPLLPAGPGCAVLITSRTRLEGLAVREGACEVAVEPFETDEAIALLREVVGSDRVADLPDMAIQVVQWCGHLPLAVCLAAERVAAHPAFTMEILATVLAEERARLDTLSAGDDEDTAVRAVFSWSYRNLSPPNAAMFRLLGLHAGPDISIPVAAALAGLTIEETRLRLEKLANAHLLEQTQPGRFRLHDLIHLYAAERVRSEDSEPDRRQMIRRELDWYVHMADAAGRAVAPTSQLVPLPRTDLAPSPRPFQSYAEALAWCDAELANLVAAVQQAAADHIFDVAWRLPAALFEFFHVRKPWRTWEKTYRTGLSAARSTGDRYGEAYMLQGLGLVDLGRQRLQDARDRFAGALAIRTDLGDQAGQAWSLTSLGHVLTALGHHDVAAENLDRARTLHRQVNDRQGEAVSLIHLAAVWRERHDHEQALACSDQALSISRAISDRHCEGLALHQLSGTCLAIDQVDQAITYLHQAMDVRDAAGDRRGEADTLRLLASALVRAGQSDQARRYLHRALAIFEALNDPAAAEVGTALEQLAQSPSGV
jgi:tetratricopeptide (TPR) repeat protein/transcriptional regulator with XRE-family HTH domain